MIWLVCAEHDQGGVRKGSDGVHCGEDYYLHRQTLLWGLVRPHTLLPLQGPCCLSLRPSLRSTPKTLQVTQAELRMAEKLHAAVPSSLHLACASLKANFQPKESISLHVFLQSLSFPLWKHKSFLVLTCLPISSTFLRSCQWLRCISSILIAVSVDAAYYWLCRLVTGGPNQGGHVPLSLCSSPSHPCGQIGLLLQVNRSPNCLFSHFFWINQDYLAAWMTGT